MFDKTQIDKAFDRFVARSKHVAHIERGAQRITLSARDARMNAEAGIEPDDESPDLAALLEDAERAMADEARAAIWLEVELEVKLR